jgi:hypothetical protein
MVLFMADDAAVDQECAIARDLLDIFAEVTVLFLRAISSQPVRSLTIPRSPICHKLTKWKALYNPFITKVTLSLCDLVKYAISYTPTALYRSPNIPSSIALISTCFFDKKKTTKLAQPRSNRNYKI